MRMSAVDPTDKPLLTIFVIPTGQSFKDSTVHGFCDRV